MLIESERANFRTEISQVESHDLATANNTTDNNAVANNQSNASSNHGHPYDQGKSF